MQSLRMSRLLLQHLLVAGLGLLDAARVVMPEPLVQKLIEVLFRHGGKLVPPPHACNCVNKKRVPMFKSGLFFFIAVRTGRN